MKAALLGLAVVVALALGLGLWIGIRAWPSVEDEVQAGLAILIGCNFVFGLWVWYRAKPGSGDAMVIPGVALLSASMLLGILPRVFWPGSEDIKIAGSIASIVATTALLIVQIRRLRSARASP